LLKSSLQIFVINENVVIPLSAKVIQGGPNKWHHLFYAS